MSTRLEQYLTESRQSLCHCLPDDEGTCRECLRNEYLIGFIASLFAEITLLRQAHAERWAGDPWPLAEANRIAKERDVDPEPYAPKR